MVEQLKGIHHVTAITSSARGIYDFYTNILGIRLVKKNVNQDDLGTYHLYFADDRGNPGTDMTFFDFKGLDIHRRGTDDISRTTFRVRDDESLTYWKRRLEYYNIEHGEIIDLFDRSFIFFEDFDHQRYAIVSDEKIDGVSSGEAWHKGPVPDEFAITGLGPIFLTVSNFQLISRVLEKIMKMELTGEDQNYYLFEMGLGGNGASVIVSIDDISPQAEQGYGGVHHVAFRVENCEKLNEWEDFFDDLELPSSGFVERFYFGSVYIMLYPNILFEIATDGPGFIDDEEDYEHLGEKLTLPPKFREYREIIEGNLDDFDTMRSDKIFEKEYLE